LALRWLDSEEIDFRVTSESFARSGSGGADGARWFPALLRRIAADAPLVAVLEQFRCKRRSVPTGRATILGAAAASRKMIPRA
jgi:hypothetical protein